MPTGSDVISGMAIEEVGLDARINFMADLVSPFLSYESRSLCDGQQTNERQLTQLMTIAVLAFRLLI